MPSSLVEQLDRLAVFPLQSVVLFPHAVVPLHIFEPRYRQMVQHALENDTPIALAMIADGETGELPDLAPVAGVGRIIHHERLEDGRYNILLRGLMRVRLDHELPVDTLYRQMRAVALVDHVPDSTLAHDTAETIRRCVFSLAAIHAKVGGALVNLMQDVEPPGVLADVLSPVLFPDVNERQRLLEEQDVNWRLEKVLGRVTELMVRSTTSNDLPN